MCTSLIITTLDLGLVNISLTLETVTPKQPSDSQTLRSPPDNRYAILNGTLQKIAPLIASWCLPQMLGRESSGLWNSSTDSICWVKPIHACVESLQDSKIQVCISSISVFSSVYFDSVGAAVCAIESEDSVDMLTEEFVGGQFTKSVTKLIDQQRGIVRQDIASLLV